MNESAACHAHGLTLSLMFQLESQALKSSEFFLEWLCRAYISRDSATARPMEQVDETPKDVQVMYLHNRPSSLTMDMHYVTTASY